MKLEIDSEKILEAASKCSTARAIFQILFPQAFTEKIVVAKVGDIIYPANYKTREKRYLVCKDKSNRIVILSCHSAYVWENKHGQYVNSKDEITLEQLRKAFGTRDIKGYEIKRTGYKIPKQTF